VARRLGHDVCYCAGQLDDDVPNPTLIPEMHFRDPEAEALGELVFGRMEPPADLLPRLEAATERLAARLRDWLRASSVDALVVENALAIPMHVPLGLPFRPSATTTTFSGSGRASGSTASPTCC
jgi:hypothetical protein